MTCLFSVVIVLAAIAFVVIAFVVIAVVMVVAIVVVPIAMRLAILAGWRRRSAAIADRDIGARHCYGCFRKGPAGEA